MQWQIRQQLWVGRIAASFEPGQKQQEQILKKVGLPPIVDGESRRLVLGSLPGDRSLATQQYYAFPQNQFWQVLSTVFGELIDDDYEARKDVLRRRNLALWDVARSASRPGSLDASMTNVIPNALPQFLEANPGIVAIGFNGRKAQQLFNRHFPGICIPSRYLPSTSPAHTVPISLKLQAWRKFLLSN